MRKEYFFDKDVTYIMNKDINDYHIKIPFNPPIKYHELPFIMETDVDNSIYSMVRELLQKLGMDKRHIGTSKWNPFRDIIKPGNKVLIKPNLVTHYHYLGGDAILSTIVHGSIIRPILDYVYLALQGKGSITIADTSLEHADFDEIMASTGIRQMVTGLKKIGYKNLYIVDFRSQMTCERKDGNLIRMNLSGDPAGYTNINLKENSCFAGLDNNPNIHYYTLADKSIDHLDPMEKRKSITDNYHNPTKHEYIIAKSVLESDVIISIAKLKTHCKAGVSLSLKNMIGIVGTKDCMPHHRPSLPPNGDAFPKYPAPYYIKSHRLYRALRKTLHIHRIPGVRAIINNLRRRKIMVGQHINSGSWKGNDTIWRTILDVNRIAYYADKDGVMKNAPQRKFFGIIDGIIGQHGDAPISGVPIRSHILLGGYNSVILDTLATMAMGIDYRLIPTIRNAYRLEKWKLTNEQVDSIIPNSDIPNLQFILPKGWRL